MHGISEIVLSDDVSELKAGKLNEICRKHRIKQEFTSVDRSQLNGVAEHGITPMYELAKARAFQARQYPSKTYRCRLLLLCGPKRTITRVVC